MREKLKDIDGQRSRFKGTFVRFGTKSGWKGRIEVTLLLKNVRDHTGKKITDHLWFNYTNGFKELGELSENDLICFDARAKPYYKGYVCEDTPYRQLDYKLSHPSKIKRLIITKVKGKKFLKLDCFI